MARLVYGLSQSLDGYVGAWPASFSCRHPVPRCFAISPIGRRLAGSLYGRRIYELMRYWDEDRPEWGEAEHAFALAWRGQPKFVASAR